MSEKTKYPVAFITTHPGGKLTTFMIEEIAHCGNKDRIKVTLDAPCNYIETNDDTKFIECVYDKDFNPKTKVVCQTKIFEGKNLLALDENERMKVFMDAASKLTAALEIVGKTRKKFEVILKCER
jgi:hypothetical protein